MNVRARHGGFCFITFIDDYTRYSHVYLISHKSETLDCFRRYIRLVENQLDKSIKALRHDYVFNSTNIKKKKKILTASVPRKFTSY